MASGFFRPSERFRLRPARLRDRSALPSIARLSLTALAAYLCALWLLEVPAPLLAPLTALLVVQVSSYQTIQHAARRVVSVTAGVIVAVVTAGLLGFSWWSLGLVIVVALVLGHVLRLGDHILEVPISAMLILQLGTEVAATDRVVETLIGAGAGLLAGLVASPLRVRPASAAIAELGRSMAGLLEHMRGGLAEEPDERAVAGWLDRARVLMAELERVDGALAAAEDSARLNPRARAVPGPGPALRAALETFEHATLTIRGLARSMADRTKLHLHDGGDLGAEMWEADVRERLSAVLGALATATRRYADAATAGPAEEAGRLVGELDGALAEGRRRRDELSWLLREDPGHWPLHGELLVHLDRLLDGLGAGTGSVTRRPVPPRLYARFAPGAGRPRAVRGPGRPAGPPAAGREHHPERPDRAVRR